MEIIRRCLSFYFCKQIFVHGLAIFVNQHVHIFGSGHYTLFEVTIFSTHRFLFTFWLKNKNHKNCLSHCDKSTFWRHSQNRFKWFLIIFCFNTWFVHRSRKSHQIIEISVFYLIWIIDLALDHWFESFICVEIKFLNIVNLDLLFW